MSAAASHGRAMGNYLRIHDDYDESTAVMWSTYYKAVRPCGTTDKGIR